MNFTAALIAIVKMGLPMTAGSWLAFRWLYSTGGIDRNTRHKDLKSRVKDIRSFTEKTKDKKAQYMLEKWAAFGSGFYGLAGLWTFFVIEVTELYNFVLSGGPAGFLDEGLISLVLSLLLNQLANFLEALFWFGYWSGPNDSTILWVIVAFIGYRAGIELAKRGISPARVLMKQKNKEIEFEETTNEQIQD